MNSVLESIKAIAKGEIVILVDDEDRENEGDLVIAADKITPESINFMAKYGRGLICLAMSPEMIDRLQLPLMTTRNESSFGTAFTLSIEARTGVTTGISASDRAHTIKTAVARNAKPTDIITPGHIFPLRARPHGVLERCGQTEGSVDLARLAGLSPAGVICEIMNDDGTMARAQDLKKFAKKHQLKLLYIRDLIRYRLQTETILEASKKTKLPIKLSDGSISMFESISFKNIIDGTEHLAVFKNLKKKNTLTRIHSECLTGDALHSMRCDCGDQLQNALQKIHNENSGILVYLRSHEGRGIGLWNKVNAYALQETGLDTAEANTKLGFPADARTYEEAAQILNFFKIKSIRLLTNNPQKVLDLNNSGIEVEQHDISVRSQKHNQRYLKTKQKKFGHTLQL